MKNSLTLDKTANFRIPGLDALRGIAALGVAIFHFHYYFDAGPNFLILQPFYNGAPFFVDLFFILSGFLLTQVYSHIKSYRELLIRRIARLFPLQWLSLILVMLGQYYYKLIYGTPFIYTFNDIYHFMLNIFLLQETGLQKGFSFNGPSWSISVEWIINLIFFIFINKSKRLIIASLILIASSLTLIVAFVGNLTYLTKLFGFLDTGLLKACFGFFIGVLTAKLANLIHHRNSANFAWDVITFLSLPALFYFLASTYINNMLGFQLAVVGLLMPLIIISVANGRIFKKLLSLRPLTWLGDISYAVYLLHFPIQIFIFMFRKHLPFPLNSGEALLCYLVLVTSISHLVFVYFERPAQTYVRNKLRHFPFVAAKAA